MMGALRKQQAESEPIASKVNRLSRELAQALDEWKDDLGGEVWTAHVSPASSSEYPIAFQNVDTSAALIPAMHFDDLEVPHYRPVYDALTNIADLLCGIISQPRCDGEEPNTTNPAGDYLQELLGVINWEKDKLVKQLKAFSPTTQQDAHARATLLIRDETEDAAANPRHIAELAISLGEAA